MHQIGNLLCLLLGVVVEAVVVYRLVEAASYVGVETEERVLLELYSGLLPYLVEGKQD